MQWLLADIAYRHPLPPTSPNDGGEAIGMIVSGILLAIASVSIVFLRKRSQLALAPTVAIAIASALGAFLFWGNYRVKETAWQNRREAFDKASERFLHAQELLRKAPPRDKRDEDRF